MKLQSSLLLAAGLAALAACGPDAADVSGSWTGAHSLNVSGAGTESGQEAIIVSQNGNDLSFQLAGCRIEADARSDDEFDVNRLECTRTVGAQSWRLQAGGKSRITARGGSFYLNASGDAEAPGVSDTTFTWTFTGTR